MASICCLVVVLLAFLLPREGVGIPLCQFKVMTRLPCFGCGLTRSFVGMARLNFGDAFFYHPFGALLFPLVLFIGLMGILPQRTRKKCADWAERNNRSLNKGAWVFLGGAIVYGLVRIAWVVATPEQASPW